MANFQHGNHSSVSVAALEAAAPWKSQNDPDAASSLSATPFEAAARPRKRSKVSQRRSSNRSAVAGGLIVGTGDCRGGLGTGDSGADHQRPGSPRRLLSMRQVVELTTYSRPSIYRLVAEGRFPKPIKL